MLTRYSQGRNKRCAIWLSLLMVCGPLPFLTSTAYAQTRQRRPNAYVYQPSSDSLAEKELSRFSKALNEAAKDAVARTNLEVAEVRVKDALLIVDCDAPTPDCMERIAQSTSAQRLYYFDIESEGNLYKLVFRYYDVPSRRFSQTERFVHKSNDAPKVFHDLILAYLADELERTRLSVISHEENLFIYIDGKNFGEVPQSIETLVPGSYQLQIVRKDVPLWEGPLDLEQSVATTIDIEIGPDGVTPTVTKTSGRDRQLLAGGAPKQPEETPSRFHWGAWTLIGTGGAALAGSAVLAYLVHQSQVEANELYDKYYDANTPEADKPGLGKRQTEVLKKGYLYQDFEFALLGIGAAALISGLIWITYDAVSSDEEESAVLAPTTYAGLAGVEDMSYMELVPPSSNTAKFSVSFAPNSVQTRLVW